MSNTAFTFFQAKHMLPRVAIFSLVVHASVFFAVALLPCASLSFGLREATESEAPVEREGSPEEVAIYAQSRMRVVRSHASIRLLVTLRTRLKLSTSSASVARSGHRLPNHLLAPLRC